MSPKLTSPYMLAALALALVVAVGATWKWGYFVAPFGWTKEPERLADVLGLAPGMEIADVGAGSGALAVTMARLVDSSGRVYATELDPDRLKDIEERVGSTGVRNVRPLASTEDGTGLPDRCCDAIYMRSVFHHIDDRHAFIADLARALRPGGRVAVIDFPPGTLWFFDNHGLRPETIVSAFESSGFRLRRRIDRWGGGLYLLLFEPATDSGR